MDGEDELLHNVSDLSLTNETYDPYNFTRPSALVVAIYEWTDALSLFIGIIANILIIYVIARNARFHTKPYIIILNVAITDILMILASSETFFLIWTSNTEDNERYHFRILMCLFEWAKEIEQLNTLVFLFILASNTIMKNKRIRLKHILCVTYGVIIVGSIIHGFVCWHTYVPPMYILFVLFYMFFFVYIIIRDCNKCYKKFVKKDPLSETTKFRLDIARIYCYNWFIAFVWYLFFDITGFDNRLYIVFLFLRLQGYFSSVLILLYLVRTDRYFEEGLRNIRHCNKMVEYDDDATIAYVEEHYKDENEEHSDPDGARVNIQN